MAGFSDALEIAILDHVYRNTAYSSPVTVYLSLHTSDPGDTGVGEVVPGGSSYARQVLSCGAAAGGQIQSNADTQFDDLPSATITHVGVWDASSAGTYISGGALNESKAVGAGDSLKIASGAFTATLD